MIFGNGNQESIYPGKINTILHDIIHKGQIDTKNHTNMLFILDNLVSFISYYEFYLIDLDKSVYNLLINDQSFNEQLKNIFSLFKKNFDFLKSVEGVNFIKTEQTINLIIKQLPFFVSFIFNEQDFYKKPTESIIAKRIEFLRYCYKF